jgi:hypothetical protein
VRTYTQNLIDAIAYCWGGAFDLEIISLTKPDATQIEFDVFDPEIAKSTSDRPLSINEVLVISTGNPFLQRALGELRGSIREPEDTGFHCKRAVEAIRHHFQGEDNDSEGWRKMRETLNLSIETLKKLNDFGTPQRHGEMPFMTYEQRKRDMKLAWSVVDRFVVFLSSGQMQLSQVDFPVV